MYSDFKMLRARLLVVAALAILAAMIWLDWNFLIPIFYTPELPSNRPIANMLLFKKSIEMGFSVFLIAIVVFILRWEGSGKTERFLASVALGVGVGFWLHRDLFDLLLH